MTTEDVDYKVQTETKEPVTISDINDITPEFLEGKISKVQKLKINSVSKNVSYAELESMIARLQNIRFVDDDCDNNGFIVQTDDSNVQELILGK